MRLALYQADIPQNAGTLLRLGACLGVAVDLIGPAGFDVSHRSLRRAAMDYLEKAEFQLHSNFDDFERWRLEKGSRLIALSSRGKTPYTNFAYQQTDILLVGRESAGLPSSVLDTCDVNVTIHMRPGMRSMNVAVAAAMVLGEALRQTGGFDKLRAHGETMRDHD
ncbi:MAG: tRNA (cytidine(34)-2'-O)-methyltransferase [Hyphomicrobiales bacterium]|nr:tRNA (cytidine(34)-2'-O)-methyltransferase [Hyphomicrobiales bacterium]